MADHALARRFFAGVDPPRELPSGGLGALEQSLQALLDEATAAWPQLHVPPEAFVSYLAERMPPDAEELPRWSASGLYLACGCARGDIQAIATFDRQMWPVVRATLQRLRIAHPLSEDIEQALREQLFVGRGERPPLILNYAGLGQLQSWLRAVTARFSRRMLERERKLVPIGDEVLQDRALSANAQPDISHLKQHYRRAFNRAFTAALKALPDRDRNLLRHRFVDGLGLQQIGAIYRVHHTTIHRRIQRAREQLLEATRERLARDVGVAPEQCESILRLVLSRFDLTLQTFIGRRAPSVVDSVEG